MIALIKRNLKIFFRDKAAVFFSLLTVFIIIALYTFFLGDLMVTDLTRAGVNNAGLLTDSWVMAGLLTVISMTTTLGSLAVMVEDRSKRIINDFSTSPLKRTSLVFGYLLSSFIIGVIMSVIAFIAAEIYIVVGGGELLEPLAIIKIFGVIVLSVLSSGSIVFFVTSFISSQSAFNNLNIVIGTLLGFLTGIYVPIGSLPSSVQTVIKLFPPTHAGVLFRQIMMDTLLKDTFGNLAPEILNDFTTTLGITISFGDQQLSWLVSLIVLIVTTIVFYALALVNVNRKKSSL